MRFPSPRIVTNPSEFEINSNKNRVSEKDFENDD